MNEGALTPGTGPQVKCAKCGDVVQSTYRWDFKSCKCGAIAIDGGDSYTRLVGDLDSFMNLDGTPFIKRNDEPGREG